MEIFPKKGMPSEIFFLSRFYRNDRNIAVPRLASPQFSRHVCFWNLLVSSPFQEKPTTDWIFCWIKYRRFGVTAFYRVQKNTSTTQDYILTGKGRPFLKWYTLVCCGKTVALLHLAENSHSFFPYKWNALLIFFLAISPRLRNFFNKIMVILPVGHLAQSILCCVRFLFPPCPFDFHIVMSTFR